MSDLTQGGYAALMAQPDSDRKPDPAPAARDTALASPAHFPATPDIPARAASPSGPAPFELAREAPDPVPGASEPAPEPAPEIPDAATASPASGAGWGSRLFRTTIGRLSLAQLFALIGAVITIWEYAASRHGIHHHAVADGLGPFIVLAWLIVVFGARTRWTLFAMVGRPLVGLQTGSQPERGLLRISSRTLSATEIWLFRIAPAVVAVVGGAIVMGPTGGLALVAVAWSSVVIVADVRVPLWTGISVIVAGALALPYGAIIAGVTIDQVVPDLLTYEASMAIWLLMGIARRQQVDAEQQTAAAHARELRMMEQESYSSALAERQAIARELHDVLAHSLGGLVVQLDAVEALVEAGRGEEAEARIVQARRLAVDGLTEARRAVAVLRGGDEAASSAPVAPEVLESAARRLAEAHRSLGGTISLTVALAPLAGMQLSGQLATAMERALQESLSNARRHAPGMPVTVLLGVEGDRLMLVVRNVLACATRSGVASESVAVAGVASGSGVGLAARARVGSEPHAEPSDGVGGGFGLRGMAERFVALGGSARGSVDTFTHEGKEPAFEVRAEAPLRATSGSATGSGAGRRT